MNNSSDQTRQLPQLGGYPKSNGRDVPRPFLRWLIAVLVPKSWKNRNPRANWFPASKDLLKSWVCKLKIDPRWHCRESMYFAEYEEQGPYILVGGSGNST